jgi:hypothetical protein
LSPSGRVRAKNLPGGAIILPSNFKPFVEKSPISIMSRGMIENVLNPEQLNKWFDSTAKKQYTKDLLFSTIFDIMSLVVFGSYRSVHAAYQASKEDVGASIVSIYNKLNGIESETSAQLVRYAAEQTEPIVKKFRGKIVNPLPGKRIKLIDGNCIEKTQHRIQELRSNAAGPLPGKSLVVYDPMLGMPIDVFPCEDGHAQERSLLKMVSSTIKANDVWIADRNFCTVEFTSNIASAGGYFVIREHKCYPSETIDKEKYIGKTETGRVYEQTILLRDNSGRQHTFRRIRIKLKLQTRDGDTEIFIISNLSKRAANAKKLADLYRSRWTIETAFQQLSEHLNSEINTLGYPKAALFGFCIALVAYIIMSVINAALAAVHGADVIAKQVSGYYIADEILATYRGMMIAIDHPHWVIFQHMPSPKLLKILKKLATKINLSKYQKHSRGPKKPQPKRKRDKNTPHVSTAKIIANRKK